MSQPWFARTWRKMVFDRLRRWRTGQLRIVESAEVFSFGDPQSANRATIHVHKPAFYKRIALGGGLGAAESFMDSEWTCDDLAWLLRLCIRNPELATGIDGGLARFSQWLARWAFWLRRNTRANARRNIHAHYDLGNEFFRLILDDTMSYSCGIFRDVYTSLYEASIAKIDRVCDKLDLRTDDEVLEIGTGWGSLAMHMAERSGCRVRTTTISRKQAEFAREQVRKRGLSDQVTVDVSDYRDLRGTYDKLVSIEMIEAVGQQYLDGYFRQCSRLLRADGAMVLQGIVMRDQLLARHAGSVDFIGKYIFPGGFLPSIQLIGDSITRVTDLRIHHLEELSPHYVRTLQMWRQKFWQNIEEVRRLGFDGRFVRMWDYYLQYCEAAFAERQVNVVQIVLAKPEYRCTSDARPTHEAEPADRQTYAKELAR